ncbi:MAG: DNA-3-methyladenine glycosylase [Candidatus Parcubacteria bacterium]|nr:DNA-3-methyladenine glycosylase [Candidatus Parcubacteria bacterium]
MSNYRRLKSNFYKKNTFKLAQSLLGKYLVRKDGLNIIIGKIVETEAYYGPHDKASHASRGKTERTKIMFDQPGLAYIYLIYGMYYCFNIVTEAKNFPAAILIRALEPVKGIPQMLKNRKLKDRKANFGLRPSALTNGPAKLCQALKINKKLNKTNLTKSKILYLTENTKEKIIPSQIQCAKRIGVDYAGTYKHKLWRYYLKDNPFVSKI